jgi:hypothetical protein
MPWGGKTSTSWQKGQSGNPGGRPKSNVVHLARQHTAMAIDGLVELASQREDLNIAKDAMLALLDRGWGKPTQMVASDPDQPVSFEIVWGPARSETPGIASNGEDKTIDAEDAEIVWGNGDGKAAIVWGGKPGAATRRG